MNLVQVLRRLIALLLDKVLGAHASSTKLAKRVCQRLRPECTTLQNALTQAAQVYNTTGEHSMAAQTGEDLQLAGAVAVQLAHLQAACNEQAS